MIVIDTNVISESWRAQPHPAVMAWLDAQAMSSLFLSAITVAELRYGLACMPEGKRRSIFESRLETEVLPAFAGRVLPFDVEISRAYGRCMATARAQGRAISVADGLIAATALAHGFAVATRDRSPFIAAGVVVLDPWQHSQVSD